MSGEGWREPDTGTAGAGSQDGSRDADPYAPPPPGDPGTQGFPVPQGYGAPPAYGTPPAYGPPGVPPQGYGPAYPPAPGQPYGYPPYGYAPAPMRTSGMAIASLVLGLVWIYWVGSILAVIFGHLALNETKRDPRVGGRGMAVAGLVLGYIGLAVLVIALIALAVSGPSPSSVD